MKFANPSTFTPRTGARLSAYATLAGAALAAPALTPTADAAVIYSGTVNLAIPISSQGIYVNVVTGATGGTSSSTTGWDFNPWGTSTLYLYGNGTGNGVLNNYTGGSSATLIDNLSIGVSVSSAFTFGNNSVETSGATVFNLNSSANYAGFKFTNESTGAVNYGWAQLSIGSAYNAAGRTIVAYAYENTGAPIAVGAVPEPATTAALGFGAMALGAAGVRQWRRRKAA